MLFVCAISLIHRFSGWRTACATLATDPSTDPFRIPLQMAKGLRDLAQRPSRSTSVSLGTPCLFPKPSLVPSYWLTLPLPLGMPSDITGGKCTPRGSTSPSSQPVATLPALTATRRSHIDSFHYGLSCFPPVAFLFCLPRTLASSMNTHALSDITLPIDEHLSCYCNKNS